MGDLTLDKIHRIQGEVIKRTSTACSFSKILQTLADQGLKTLTIAQIIERLKN